MKRTCTTMLSGPDPLVFGTFHGTARRTRAGIVFDLRTADHVGSVSYAGGDRPELTSSLYAELTAKQATDEYPPIEWQRKDSEI